MSDFKWEKRFERERSARKRAETLLDEKSRDLFVANEELKRRVEQLKMAQRQLVESEKMVALGSLVAGISHEINTPIGVSMTAATSLSYDIVNFNKLVDSKNIKFSDLKKILESTSLSANIIYSNLKRAAELISSFKEIAVNQSTDSVFEFLLSDLLQKIKVSLSPQFKGTPHEINITCPEDILINSYPGVFVQIFTILIFNSLSHGFDDGREGKINIDAQRRSGSVVIVYKDNGKGISKANLKRVFEPFFTTKLGAGGSGLGMHILYNLITQKLRGSVDLYSDLGDGVSVIINLESDAKCLTSSTMEQVEGFS